ncbi:MAG: hypothetical protein QOE70_1366 [Chthoniobacter sp.]|nr:hypothetical protein [Chthoniobacter sp.]
MAILLLFLPLPLIVSGIGVDAQYILQVENRPIAPLPWQQRGARPAIQEYFSQLDRAFVDRMPWRGTLLPWKLSLDRDFGQRQIFGKAYRGSSNWYFFGDADGNLLGSIEQVEAAVAQTEYLITLARNRGKTMRVVVVPDKESIYPEYLSAYGVYRRGLFGASRNRMNDLLNGITGPELIHLDRLLSRVKASSPSQLLYWPDDTHFNTIGSALLVRSIVESLQPGLWSDEEVIKVRVGKWQGDLSNLAGFRDAAVDKPIHAIVRRDVHQIAEEWLGAQRNMETPVRYLMQAANGPGLVKGKTLIIHDSFIGNIRPQFAQFFEDGTYVHSAHFQTAQLISAFTAYDNIVLESVERTFPIIALKILPVGAQLNLPWLRALPAAWGPAPTEMSGIGRLEGMTVDGITVNPRRSPISLKRNSMLHVGGWAVDSGRRNAPREVLIRMRGRDTGEQLFLEAVRRPRPDVAQVFGNPKYLLSGFELAANLPSDLRAGVYDFAVLQKAEARIVEFDPQISFILGAALK